MPSQTQSSGGWASAIMLSAVGGPAVFFACAFGMFSASVGAAFGWAAAGFVLIGLPVICGGVINAAARRL